MSNALPVRIRQIPAQLLKFPVGVLGVKVAGFKPPSVNTEESVLPYCPEWSLKATMEMIGLLQTNIRASVVVRNTRFMPALALDVLSSPPAFPHSGV